jgi:hypothetical protein
MRRSRPKLGRIATGGKKNLGNYYPVVQPVINYRLKFIYISVPFFETKHLITKKLTKHYSGDEIENKMAMACST